MKNKQSTRFDVGDIIENVITGKQLEVGEVVRKYNRNDILIYGLYMVGHNNDVRYYDRDIPGSAFNNWKLIN